MRKQLLCINASQSVFLGSLAFGMLKFCTIQYGIQEPQVVVQIHMKQNLKFCSTVMLAIFEMLNSQTWVVDDRIFSSLQKGICSLGSLPTPSSPSPLTYSPCSVASEGSAKFWKEGTLFCLNVSPAYLNTELFHMTLIPILRNLLWKLLFCLSPYFHFNHSTE